MSKTRKKRLNRSRGRMGKRIGAQDEKDVMKHVDRFAKVLNFDDCKSNRDELIDSVLWFNDILLLIEVKTRVDSQREIREWARRQIKKARKQIEKAHDKIKSGHHITLTNSIYNGIVLDNNRISNMIGIIVLKCEEDLPFTPYNLDPEMANCDIPIYVFSYKAFLRTAHQMNTIPDFIYHLPERGNELSILGRDFVKQTLGLHIPEDELKLHPSGIHHVVETIPLPRGNSTPVKTNWYPLNMGEDPRLSGKETSFWTEHVENTLIDGLKDPEGTFKEFTSNLRNETFPAELHLLWALASLPRVERDRASDCERVQRTLVNRKEFDFGGWVHTNHSSNQHIVFHFSKFKSWNEILPALMQNVKQNIIDKHIPTSSCVAVCYDITEVKESPEHVDVSYQLVSTNMLDTDFITKNF